MTDRVTVDVEYVRLVARMRQAQAQFFRTGNRSLIEHCRALEKEVDEHTGRILSGQLLFAFESEGSRDGGP